MTLDQAVPPAQTLTAAAPRPMSAGQDLAALARAARQPREYHHFEIPESCPLEDRTILMTGHGRLALVSLDMKKLTAQEQRAVYQRGASTGSDAILGILETTEAFGVVKVAPIAPVLERDLDGQEITVDRPNLEAAWEFEVSTKDGSAEALYAGMSQAMRKLVTIGYAAATSPDDRTASLFMASRKTVTR